MGRRYALEKWRFSVPKDKPKPGCLRRKWNEFLYKLKCYRDEHWFWNCLIILPGLQSQRPAFHPDVYGFDHGPKSRKKFQRRFILGIGINFVLSCFEIIIGFQILNCMWKENVLLDRLHLCHATHFWLTTIPTYCLSLFFVFLFYNKGHVWKKEGVSVGFKYDCTVRKKKWQRKFYGEWVASSIKKESTNESTTSDSNKLLLVFIIMMTVILITILSIVVFGG